MAGGEMEDSFFKYLEFEKRYSQKTVIAYRTDLKQFGNFLKDQFNEIDLYNAEYGTIRAWIISLVEAGLDPRSINRKIASLRTYFKFQLKQERISRNPLSKIKVLKTSKKLPHFVQEQEMATLLDVTFEDNFEGWRDRLILELFYGTGIRLAELIGLRESQIDMGGRTIKVLGKRNKERVIPFAPILVSIMKGYITARNREVEMKEKDCLFVTAKGDPLYPMLVYRVVKKYLDLFSAVEKRSPHVLRHSFATHLLNKGAEINAVKDLLGHSSLAATQVYTHNSMERLKKVFDQAHPKA